VRLRFHRNDGGEPHIHDHGVEEWEVREALQRRLEQVAGRENSTVFIGRTVGGRVLRIVFTEARDGDGIFVVTAYDLPAKQLRTLRKRLKRRGSS
jgi:hypothetical protein